MVFTECSQGRWILGNIKYNWMSDEKIMTVMPFFVWFFFLEKNLHKNQE